MVAIERRDLMENFHFLIKKKGMFFFNTDFFA